ncbi:hypothetical protein J23TS9_34730 [Paenibacillus sp. J23TS9]|uniref:hypothetical protein n=1 Tax=Paenibacillus sp. J23TS9 TaxID=2807193 RepID=UPI001B151C37|nr:hypothetical protein [Paenibacillus sp. J23TS9]GIP28343.1 hypothetical protein J23TS9_34730 [Paenibacillus sp. J23TS9]
MNDDDKTAFPDPLHRAKLFLIIVAAVVLLSAAATEEVASMSSQQYAVSEKLVALSARLEDTSRQLQQSMIPFRI